MKRRVLVSTDGLQYGVDFEIVSLLAIDDEGEFHTFENAFRESSKDYCESFSGRDLAEKMIEGKDNESVDLIETHMDVFPPHFLSIKGIDFKVAVEVGLGVVKMFTGEYEGQYLLYNSISEEGLYEEVDDAIYQIEEIYKLGMYKVLTDEVVDSKELEKVLIEDPMYLSLLCPCDGSKIIGNLRRKFQSKKGGNNVIPLRR